VFVAKSEGTHWPLIGALASGIGTIFFARGQASDAVAEHMTWLLVQGERVSTGLHQAIALRSCRRLR
jgi:1-acyl-sn-glycerol-3-phosphate acyltransferase